MTASTRIFIKHFQTAHLGTFSRRRQQSPKNIKNALDFTANLQANMGGTELESALQIALGFSCRKTITQDIILITDGEVWNIDETTQMAVKGNRRIFSIGVGSSPAESLLKTLSAKTGGACEFVFPGESMTEKIMRHARRICSPQIKCIETIWPATPEKTHPETLQGVFDGDTVHVFGWFLERPESGNIVLSITLSNGQMWEISAGELSLSTACKSPGLVARMSAALRLTDMMDKDAATELAVHYQLLSRYTHCLAIMLQTEAEKAQTLPELHKVKRMLAAGWGGAGQICSDIDVEFDYDDRLDIRGINFGDNEIEARRAVNNALLSLPRFSESLSHLDSGETDDEISMLEFVNYLNRYNTKLDPVLSFIYNDIPSAIRKAIDNIDAESSNSDFSRDDILTVFLHLFLQSDYGKHLNRKMSRIIKKRFKQAKVSKELVNQISDIILPILS